MHIDLDWYEILISWYTFQLYLPALGSISDYPLINGETESKLAKERIPQAATVPLQERPLTHTGSAPPPPPLSTAPFGPINPRRHWSSPHQMQVIHQSSPAPSRLHCNGSATKTLPHIESGPFLLGDRIKTRSYFGGGGGRGPRSILLRPDNNLMTEICIFQHIVFWLSFSLAATSTCFICRETQLRKLNIALSRITGESKKKSCQVCCRMMCSVKCWGHASFSEAHRYVYETQHRLDGERLCVRPGGPTLERPQTRKSLDWGTPARSDEPWHQKCNTVCRQVKKTRKSVWHFNVGMHI